MLPIWMIPPNGLTNAQRRVLEGYFVAEDVKATANLLSLARKTIENELLLARQTMNESKSWMASIRYVFYAKKHGHPFVESHLTPKIDRQVRRLVDNYLESIEDVATDGPTSSRELVRHEFEPDTEPSPRGSSEHTSAQTDIVVADEFDAQIRGLIKVAAMVYERPRKRKMGLLVGSLMLTGVATAAIWTYATKRLTLEQIEAGLKAIEPQIKANGAKDAQISRCASLIDDLCERYEEEKWGPYEETVVAVFKRHSAEIGIGVLWATDHEPKVALKILGNGHRGFSNSQCMFGKWFPCLQQTVNANAGDTSVYMVRALCGMTYGCLNNGGHAGIDLSSEYVKSEAPAAAEKALQIVSQKEYPYDYANAVRHLGMAQSNENQDIRFKLIDRALSSYKRLGGLKGQRGEAQCLLSFGQTGSIDTTERFNWDIRAYHAIKALQNKFFEDECVREMAQNIPNLVKSSMPSQGKLEVREILWGDAISKEQEFSLNDQFKDLKSCLAIDYAVKKERVPSDIQAIVLSKAAGDYDTPTRGQLGGFAWKQILLAHQTPDPKLRVNSRGRDNRFGDFEMGQKLTVEQAIFMVNNWPPRKADEP